MPRASQIALRGSLEFLDLPHPADQWVPFGENLGHHLQVIDSKGMRSATHTANRCDLNLLLAACPLCRRLPTSAYRAARRQELSQAARPAHRARTPDEWRRHEHLAPNKKLAITAQLKASGGTSVVARVRGGHSECRNSIVFLRSISRSSLESQRDHRIHLHRPPCRDYAGDKGNCSQNRRHAREGGNIERLVSVEKTGEQPRSERGTAKPSATPMATSDMPSPITSWKTFRVSAPSA